MQSKPNFVYDKAIPSSNTGPYRIIEQWMLLQLTTPRQGRTLWSVLTIELRHYRIRRMTGMLNDDPTILLRGFAGASTPDTAHGSPHGGIGQLYSRIARRAIVAFSGTPDARPGIC